MLDLIGDGNNKTEAQNRTVHIAVVGLVHDSIRPTANRRPIDGTRTVRRNTVHYDYE